MGHQDAEHEFLDVDGQGSPEGNSERCIDLMKELMDRCKTEEKVMVAFTSSMILSRALVDFVINDYEKKRPSLEGLDDPDSDSVSGSQELDFWLEGREDLEQIRNAVDWSMTWCTRQMGFRLMVTRNTELVEEIKQWMEKNR